MRIIEKVVCGGSAAVVGNLKKLVKLPGNSFNICECVGVHCDMNAPAAGLDIFRK